MSSSAPNERTHAAVVVVVGTPAAPSSRACPPRRARPAAQVAHRSAIAGGGRTGGGVPVARRAGACMRWRRVAGGLAGAVRQSHGAGTAVQKRAMCVLVAEER